MKRPSDENEKKITVLVLDDLATWRNLVHFILEKELGISAVLASSGREALNVLESFRFDVVLCDINMPEMNGMQFLSRARAMAPRTKFVMMTADLVTRAMSEECIARGAFGVISKEEIDPDFLKLLRYLMKSNEMPHTC